MTLASAHWRTFRHDAPDYALRLYQAVYYLRAGHQEKSAATVYYENPSVRVVIPRFQRKTANRVHEKKIVGFEIFVFAWDSVVNKVKYVKRIDAKMWRVQ